MRRTGISLFHVFMSMIVMKNIFAMGNIYTDYTYKEIDIP